MIGTQNRSEIMHRSQCDWQPVLIVRLRQMIGSFAAVSLLAMEAAIALPPPSDTPEELLRTQIETAARAVTDGEPLTPAEYAELEAQLKAGPGTPAQLDSQVRHIIFLLQIRKMLKTLIPF